MTDPHSIARDLVGEIEWQDNSRGFCRCPGQHLHSSRNGRRDCEVFLDRVPTVHCVHSSCSGILEKANHDLRSAIAKGALNGAKYRPTAEDIRRQQERQEQERLAQRAESALPRILAKYACEIADLRKASPERLVDPRDDWRLLLSLFEPSDVVWIGQPTDSGQPEHSDNFRPVEEWLKEAKAPNNFTVPTAFKPESISRSNENTVRRPYLVIESDTLAKTEIAAVFQWCREFMRLRAVIDTGGRSLHGWFDFPSVEHLAELKIILPKFGCDPALFKPSQPVRLPGAWRAEKSAWQKLIYLDGGAA